MAVGNEKAPKEIICPGCGGVIKNTAFNPITDTCGAMLQDGWLCPECAYRLRPKYPMYYTDDEPATLEKAPDAGRPILTMLRNDFLYADPLDPVNSTAFSYTGALRSDPLAKLRSDQIKDELASIDAYKQEVSKRFGGAKNVFEVLEVAPMPKLKPFCAGLPNIKRLKGTIAIAGNVRLGAFAAGDIATVHHGGMRYPAKVLINRATTGFLRWWMFPNAIIGQPLPTVSTIDSSDLIPEKGGLTEGWHGVLVLSPEASDIAPGDALTLG